MPPTTTLCAQPTASTRYRLYPAPSRRAFLNESQGSMRGVFFELPGPRSQEAAAPRIPDAATSYPPGGRGAEHRRFLFAGGAGRQMKCVAEERSRRSFLQKNRRRCRRRAAKSSCSADSQGGGVARIIKALARRDDDGRPWRGSRPTPTTVRSALAKTAMLRSAGFALGCPGRTCGNLWHIHDEGGGE